MAKPAPFIPSDMVPLVVELIETNQKYQEALERQREASLEVTRARNNYHAAWDKFQNSLNNYEKE